jgi:hypothetical protein
MIRPTVQQMHPLHHQTKTRIFIQCWIWELQLKYFAGIKVLNWHRPLQKGENNRFSFGINQQFRFFVIAFSREGWQHSLKTWPLAFDLAARLRTMEKGFEMSLQIA